MGARGCFAVVMASVDGVLESFPLCAVVGGKGRMPESEWAGRSNCDNGNRR